MDRGGGPQGAEQRGVRRGVTSASRAARAVVGLFCPSTRYGIV